MKSLLNREYDDIESCAYYLISLFYKTGCKYACYRTKLNRLLAIYRFCRIDCIDIKQDCNLIITEEGMMGFPILHKIIDRDVYFSWYVDETGEKITEEFVETIEIPREYIYRFREEKINDYSKMILESIFRNFGNYSINDLANMLNDIGKKIPTIEHTIDVDKFIDFINDNENSNLYRNNKIFNFIKSFYNTENIKSTDDLSFCTYCNFEDDKLILNERREKQYKYKFTFFK